MPSFLPSYTASIDAQDFTTPEPYEPPFEGPAVGFPQAGEPLEPREPWEPRFEPEPTEFPPTGAGNPPLWRWPQKQQQDAEEQEAPDVESESDFDSEVESEVESEYEAADVADAPDAVAAGAGQSSGQQGAPANFFNFGGNAGAGGNPIFKGFKKPTKEDAKQITGKTIGIILSTLFLVAIAAVVAVFIVRKKQNA